MMWWSIVLGVLIVVAVLYVAAMVWDAKHSVSLAPRADMLLCDRHGAVPMKYAVELNTAGATEQPIQYCPFCFEDKMKNAQTAK